MKTLPIDEHNQGIFFHKLGHFFPIIEKGQGRPPPSPSSYAPEHVSRSLIICVTQLAGGLPLKILKYFQVMWGIFQFSLVK